MKNIEHEYTQEIVCPNCGEEMSDSWEYAEDGIEECGKCEKQFSFQRITTVEYSTNKI